MYSNWSHINYTLNYSKPLYLAFMELKQDI